MTVLVLTYHAIGTGRRPLFVEPELLREQLDTVVDSGAAVLTVSELADALRARRMPERAVALTFDDGAESVVTEAAPLLLERKLRATVFCVAGHLGGWSDWASGRACVERFRLASASDLAELARAGFEIGSHGVAHAPLGRAEPALARREVVESKTMLEQALGAPVRAFAYPYGSVGAEPVVRSVYTSACTTRLASVRPDTDAHAVPRVDVHYVRRIALLERVLEGAAEPYLGARRAAARARRVLRPDHEQ